MERPTVLPQNPCFSSGPCAKRPGWSLHALSDATIGRSHRAKLGKGKLKDVIDRSKAILGMPQDYRLAIVAGSDTGAVEMALWTLLGSRGVDILSWEAFGDGWHTDALKQLKLKDIRRFHADYGQLPDLGQVDCTRDVIFTWNGTTSGVRVPNADWIANDREGLTICDATSAAFAMELPWSKLDVVTWSWQKVLGGEAAHGMLALSPRAIARLEAWTPPWPLPKTFRMTKGGKVQEGIFAGETINTPSMLAVEDALDGLKWAESIGGLPALIVRSESNLAVVAQWVANSTWAAFLCADAASRSCTSVCLTICDPWFASLDAENQAAVARTLGSLVESARAGYDIGAYRDAPAGLRIWCGATVEQDDVRALLPWLDWAWSQVRAK